MELSEMKKRFKTGLLKIRAQLIRKPENLLRFASLLIAILISACVFVFRGQLNQLGNYGYVGIFLLSIAGNATIVLPMPVILTAFLGGSIFDPVIVGVVTAAGATIGELTGYLAGVGGQPLLENHKKTQRINKWLDRHGLLALFFLAAIPNPFFDLAGIAAGALRFPLSHFLLATWLGKTVKFLGFALLGAESVSLLEKFL
jgi:uncharacterized membrane protein YdjX (TVP38/TMEM64 family)